MALPKRGLSWPWNNPKERFALYEPYARLGKLSWLYNWELWRPDSCPAAFEYVPSVRTAKEAKQIDQFLTGLWPNPKADGEVRHFLGFNEPDVSSQANMTVSAAAGLWKMYVQPAKANFGLRLGSPAVSSAPEGLEWLRSFFDRIGEEGRGMLDFVAVHWYGTDVEALQAYLRSMHEEFKKPVWLTEIAFTRMESETASVVDVKGFMQTALGLLEGCEFVERYAYFGAMEDTGEWVGRANCFVDGKGGLSEVGKLYCEM